MNVEIHVTPRQAARFEWWIRRNMLLIDLSEYRKSF